MNITLWGTRGSVPVSGSTFVRHGGSTTCIEVHAGDRRIVVDCGTGLASLGRSGGVWTDTLVLQTHLHWDHVQGFPFFGPLFDPAASFEFWSVDRDGETLHDVLARQMSRPTFPVGLDVLPSTLDFRTIGESGIANLDDVTIRWEEMWHPSGSTAYRIEHGGHAFVFTGDVEAQQGSADDIVALAHDADVLVMDAQYFPDEYTTRVGWGHSTPTDAVEIALRAGASRLVMTHHDPAHDDVRLQDKLDLARGAAKGTSLVVDNAYDQMTIELGRSDSLAAA